MAAPTPPADLVDDLRRLTSAELSSSARMGYVALLLASATLTAIVSALLLTEPVLPTRASLALGVLVAIGLGWMSFSAWVLTRKRVLLGRHRVVASRLAVTFSSVFLVGALLVFTVTGQRSAFAAAGLGVLMLTVAISMLVRATRSFSRLSARRDALERQLRRNER